MESRQFWTGKASVERRHILFFVFSEPSPGIWMDGWMDGIMDGWMDG